MSEDLDEINNLTEPVIGIDLGTRYSCVSIWRNKRFEIISDQFGNRTVPSVVSFYKSARLAGYNALSMKDVNPANTIYDIKRIIGRRIDDEIVEKTKKLISYEITDDQSVYKNIIVQLDRKDCQLSYKSHYRPEEICAYILIEIKRMATNYLHQDVKKAVITVPAYFNDSQRQATLDAAKIAGLTVLKIINEPTAAALAYGLGNKKKGNIIIYDFGAGTLDVSLMNINNGVFRSLAVSGNMHLGGEDIDYLIMEHVMKEFQKQNKISDLNISKVSQVKLKNSVENAKKILSTVDKAIIFVDEFYNGQKLVHPITREFFDTMCNHLFIIALKPLRDVLDSANMTKHDIDEVILVGGSTRIPKIRKMISAFFKDTNVTKLTNSLNPDEVVSAGASIYGYIITHNEDPFSDNLVLLDITPLSLGVETLQKQMTTIIPRNTVIPTRKIKMFSTDTDFQDTVAIKIFEGERKLTKDNFHVGTFELSGFESGPRGYPTIKITFEVDINGILQVTAHEKKSDVKNGIKITSTWGAKGRLSKNEIDIIISEAEKNDQIDTIYSLKVGLIHKINTICNAILINLSDNSFALTNADKKKIKIDVKNNLKWLKNKDFAQLPVDELESRELRLSKTYAPLIAHTNKKEDTFMDSATTINATDIHGDDDTNIASSIYEECKLSCPEEYNKEEIKALKHTISDLCHNIVSVINNPVSNFNTEDITHVTDYIESVQIWLYTSSATTTIEFISKINEINKFTEDIIKKYDDKKIFEKNDKFTTRDELQLTCLTLNTAIKTKYFSLKNTEIEKLTDTINETMIWLISNQNEKEAVYKQKLADICDLCNFIYHGIHNMKLLDNVVVDDNDNDLTDSEDEINNIVAEIPTGNRINENIDSILNTLPGKLIKKKSADILLKIDMNKLSSTTFKYKNNEQHFR